MDLKAASKNEGKVEVQSKVKSTLELLKKGDKDINLSDKYKDIVLILGNTGSGKSTFTQLIAGDNEKLLSVEVKKGLSEFIIIDNNRISNSTIQSKTLFPELQIDAETNTAFYDCPGFSDTRSTIIDIASTYFIKKLVDHARSVKMIFTISHPSVRKGVDRQDFMKLMKHATDFLKHIDKFRSSIALVATKVDNLVISHEETYTLVPDDIVVGAIGDFLREAKEDLLEKLKLTDISTKEQGFYRNSIKLIDIFSVKEGSTYLNIGIFRRPNKLGPVSKIPLLQKGKAQIKNIIQAKLNFTIKNSNDFGYTLSEKSKNEIHDLVEEINKNVWSYGKFISENVESYYHDLMEEVRARIKTVLTCPDNCESDELEAQTFSSKFTSGFEAISFLEKELQAKGSIEELAVKLNSTLHGLGINALESYISDIASEGKYFNFLQVVSDKELSTRQWGELFKDKIISIPQFKRNIQNYVEEKATLINELLKESINNIHQHYDEKMKVLGIQRLPDELNEALTVIQNIKKEIENTSPSADLLQKTYSMVKTLGLNFSKSRVHIIVSRKKNLKFLQVVSGINLVNEKMPWLCPFENAITYLNDSFRWYKYLNSLHSMLSQYKVQANIGRFNVVDIDDWGKDGKPQGIAIWKSNFQKFVNKTAEYNIVEHNNIKNIEVTESQLEELNNVLNVALKQRLQVKCEEPYVFIMGDYINFQDISNEIKTNNKHCWGSSINDKYKFINIFALNTVFIDKDLSLPGLELSISVIAPKWEVIGSREIDLHGPDAPFEEIKKTSWSVCSGQKGRNGKPGEPGGPGGSFLGVTEHIIDGEYLTITTNGGSGSSGQKGGDGSCGSDGMSATELTSSTPCKYDLCVGHSDCKHIKSYYYEKIFPTTFETPETNIGRNYTNIFELYGKPGMIGGKGGDGGVGGKGGNPGHITLFELNKNSGVLKRKNTGRNGNIGLGGKGGSGGKSGTNLTMTCTMVNWNGKDGPVEWKVNKRIEGTISESGENGSDGTNSNGLKYPKSANVIRTPKILNEYKQYLRHNLNNQLRKYPLNHFLSQIDNNKDVISTYDSLGLVGELQGLEAQCHNLNSVMDVLPFYQSLLKRVHDYAKKTENSQKSLEQKKILCYLYTAILGRIQNHKENLEANLVINVTGYIESVKEDLNALKDLRNSKKKIDVIKKHKMLYEEKIVAKVKEAKHFIEKEISPEMDKIGIEIGDMVELLISEVKDLQKQSQKELEALIEKRKKLQQALKLQGIVGVLSIFSHILSFLGPTGEVLGSVIRVGGSIADTSLLLSSKSPDIRLLKLPKSVSDIETIKKQINDIRNEKLSKFRKLLEHMSEEVENDLDNLGDVKTKISEINKKLSKDSSKEFSFKDFKKIENYRKELKETLLAKERELIQYEKHSKTRRALIIIDKGKKFMELSSTFVETAIRYKNDQLKLDEIDDAIKEAGVKIQELKEYEENIYTTIAPMLQNVINDLNEIQSKLGTKSKVALDVTKWKTQGIIKNMKEQMNQLTEGFKSGNNLVQSIDKLNEAMNTLIIVYDHIQDFQDQQTLANYIADISSADAENINISDEELRDAVTNLEITIRSSIILERYKVAVDAFKQFVFPFAHLYFKDIVLPHSLELQGNERNNVLDNVVENAAKQIEHIKSKYTHYNLSITQTDGYVGTGEFSSNYKTLKPFFIWKNEFHKNMLSKLLSGQEVVVNTDILSSAPDKDAIKFNVIDFKFKAINETMQSKINTVLEGFEIRATHLGNSYYRYKDKIYLITTNSQPIWYYFEKNDKNEPAHKAVVYDKIRAGEFMLSPYASWKIKLSNISDNISFDDLKIFIDEINLELGGHGHYLNKRKMKDSELNVEKYYDAVETLYPIDLKDKVEKENMLFFKDRISTKNKRDVDGVMQKSIPPSYGEYLEAHHVANSAVHFPSPINSLFSWLKKQSIALVSSILPGNILDILNAETENDYYFICIETPAIKQNGFNNDGHCYKKQEGFSDVVYDKDFEAEETLGYIIDSLKPQHINSREDDYKSKGYELDYNTDNMPSLNINVIIKDPPYNKTYEWNSSKQLFSTEEQIDNSLILPSLEGWGSLMLADVVTRFISKEKHKQNSMVDWSPIVEKSIELYHLEQKVNKGLQKMSLLFGDCDVEEQ